MSVTTAATAAAALMGKKLFDICFSFTQNKGVIPMSVAQELQHALAPNSD